MFSQKRQSSVQGRNEGKIVYILCLKKFQHFKTSRLQNEENLLSWNIASKLSLIFARDAYGTQVYDERKESVLLESHLQIKFWCLTCCLRLQLKKFLTLEMGLKHVKISSLKAILYTAIMCKHLDILCKLKIKR